MERKEIEAEGKGHKDIDNAQGRLRARCCLTSDEAAGHWTLVHVFMNQKTNAFPAAHRLCMGFLALGRSADH